MEKEETAKALKELANKGLKKLKEQNIPEKLKDIAQKGAKKLKEQNIPEKLNTLKDKGVEVAKEAYDKNKSADACWRKFLSAHPKVKYALYGLCGLLVIYCIMPNTQKVYTSSDVENDESFANQNSHTARNEEKQLDEIKQPDTQDDITQDDIDKLNAMGEALVLNKSAFEKFPEHMKTGICIGLYNTVYASTFSDVQAKRITAVMVNNYHKKYRGVDDNTLMNFMMVSALMTENKNRYSDRVTPEFFENYCGKYMRALNQ